MIWRGMILAALLLVGCQPEPRSASYFEAHPADARKVEDACRAGAHRGRECEAAQAGLVAPQANRRLELFKKSFR